MKIRLNLNRTINTLILILFVWNLIEVNIYHGVPNFIQNYIPSYIITFISLIFILSIYFYCGRKKIGILLFYIFVLISILLSAQSDYTHPYIEQMFYGISQIKLYFIVPLLFACIYDFEDFSKKLYYCSIFVSIIHIYEFMNHGYLNSWGGIDYMLFGIDMLIPIGFILQHAFLKQKLSSCLISFFLCAFTIINGHRGAFLVIVALLIIYIYIYTSFEKKILFIFLLIFFSIILFFNWSIVVKSIIDFSNKIGFDSRTIRMILEGSITDNSGRTEIWNIIIQRIKEHFFLGTGIGSDRYFLNSSLGVDFYTHNFILELILSYGIVIGLTLLFGVIKMGYVILKTKKQSDLIVIMTPFYIISIFTLLTSSSIFEFQSIYIAIILYLCYISKSNVMKNKNHKHLK